MSDANRETINLLRQMCNMLGGASSSGSGLAATNPAPAPQNTGDERSSSASIHSFPVENRQTPQLPAPSTSRQNQSGQSRRTSVEEHRRLFSCQSRIQPYGNRPASQQRRRTVTKKEKTVTRTMFCLADKNQTQVPSCYEKLELLQNGLGEKRVSFPSSATSSIVKDLLYETYPPLRHTGGFQLLLCKEKSRKELRVVSHGCGSTEQIRCFGTGRIYIRPLQRSIPITKNMTMKEEFEECLSCLLSVPVSEMREHRENCIGIPTSSGDESEKNETDGGAFERNIDHADNPHNDERESARGNSGSGRGNGNGDGDGNGDGSTSAAVSEENTEVVTIINLVDDNSREVLGQSLTDSVEQVDRDVGYAEHLQKAINATVSEMKECQEPVTVLRTFQRHFLRGRPLDLESDSSICEGNTTEIVVSRLNLFEDSMDEFIASGTGHDPSIPLEVTFTGECAEDFGGPRREFLGAMVREIKDRLFTKAHDGDDSFTLTTDVVSMDRKYYYGAGIVFGYSILQGGPLPCFIHQSLLQKLFGNEHAEALNQAEAQLRDGVAKFGLVELFQKKPCLRHLLTITAVSAITYPKLVKLLSASFSPEGSNRRMREEKTYRYFLNYMKEVAAGRRGSILLGDILKFVTGSENEPILGYRMKPIICFNDGMPSCIPTSNTCINKLTLPIGDILPDDKDEIFKYFDYAFTNDYFGMV